MAKQMFDFRILLLAGLIGVNVPALAQVFRSTDADGNVTFSDQPAPENEAVTNEAVTIPEPNVGDAVKVPPPAPVVEPTPVARPEPEVAVEKTPAAVEGDLVGETQRRKKHKRRRPRAIHY